MAIPLFSRRIWWSDLCFRRGPLRGKYREDEAWEYRRADQSLLENLKEVLKAANSSLELVLKIQVYCSNSGHYDRFNKVYIEYFPKDPPARTFIVVGSFGIDFDIEIDAIAALKE